LDIPTLPVLAFDIGGEEASVVTLLNDDKGQGRVVLGVDAKAGGLDGGHLKIKGGGGVR